MRISENAQTGILLVAILVMSGLFLTVFSWEVEQRQRADRAERDVQFWRDTVWTQQGFTQGYGNYSLVSFDKGMTWWDRKTQPDGSVLLVRADEVGRQARAFDKLSEYARVHGPLNPANPEDRAVFEAAGFVVSDSGLIIKGEKDGKK